MLHGRRRQPERLGLKTTSQRGWRRQGRRYGLRVGGWANPGLVRGFDLGWGGNPENRFQGLDGGPAGAADMTTDTKQGQGATKDNSEHETARAVALREVLRINPERLEADELEMAAGLQLGLRMALKDGKPVFVDDAGQPIAFSPMSNWEHFGRVLTGIDIVTGSHAICDDPKDLEKVTGYWFSAHSFYSGTNTEGNDLRDTVLTTVAKRLAHDTKYPPG